MENILGRQLWSIYEGLKRDNKIGFLTDYEFQKYYLGFISNGMTNNEKIDEYNYFDNILDETVTDDE